MNAIISTEQAQEIQHLQASANQLARFACELRRDGRYLEAEGAEQDRIEIFEKIHTIRASCYRSSCQIS